MTDITASLVSSFTSKNNIFNLHDKNNRDNCFQPYVLLREKLKLHNILISSHDVLDIKNVNFELHIDVQARINRSIDAYLIMLETPQIYKNNGITSKLKNYKKVFTWNDDLVDGVRFIKINFPNLINIPKINGWSNRNHFCCVIAGNKSLSISDSRDLYKDRVKTIRWFEKHAPKDFDLYGVGWDVPALGAGFVGKITRKIFNQIKPIVKLKPFPSYRGKIDSKKEVLLKTRFSICYENVSHLPGYITEKIFDSFFAGCVPVYWGASNITDYIPKDCFIDRRDFKDTADVYKHLKSITEAEFISYQQKIAAFLASDAAYPFSAEFFAETIVNTIVQDIEH